MNRTLLVAIATAVLIGGFALAARVYRTRAIKTAAATALEQPKTLVPDYAQRLGNPAARVVIVEFFDPACEACAKFSPVLKEIVQREPGRVQLVLRYATFHRGSDTVAAILEASRRQDRYWETLEIMFSQQSKWASYQNPQPELIWGLLEQGGIDVARLRSDMDDPAIAEVVARDMQDVKRLGVKKTPSFFVNGKPLTSFGQPQLAALVEAELEAAY
ncbi:MAG: thioredoxin domain-containing protein [Myxococcota bacterium]